MRLNMRAASSIASALPSSRVLLLFGGVVAFSESILLATALFAGAFVSFVASLVVATVIYRSAAPRLADEQEHTALRGAEPIAARQ
jgi:hypothetical protein